MDPLPSLQIFGLTAVNMAYGFMLANQGLLLAPLEAEHLFPHQASLGLAGLAVCCGAGLLFGPAAGRWSDQQKALTGRRTICLLKAGMAAIILTGFLPVFSAWEFGGAFTLVFFLQQIAWSALYTVQVALVSDLVPSDQQGTAGGMAAVNILTGAFGGLLAVRFMGWLHLSNHYIIGGALTAICMGFAYLTAAAKEAPTSGEEAAREVAAEVEAYGAGDLLRAYKFDIERHPDFARLLLSKALYSASVVVKGFLLYFVQDTFHLHKAQEQALVGDAAISAEAAAVLAAGLSISFLNQPARMPTVGKDLADPGNTVRNEQAQRAAMSGAIWMAFLWFGPVMLGYGVLRESQAAAPAALSAAELWLQVSPLSADAIAQHWTLYMLAGTAVWGLGQGCYLAGDQALAYSLVPDRKEASRYLGLASVWSSFGAVIGGSFAGGLLHIFGSFGSATIETLPPDGIPSDAPGYAYLGYAAMFLFASSLCAGSRKSLSSIGSQVAKAGPTECTPIVQ